jgi:hypothetical protein
MIKIAFLLGRPGSGKSIGARLIEIFARENGWSVEYMNDYRLLQQMFLQERAEHTPPAKRKFSTSGPIEYNGFDVVDFSVLDTVLEIMADQVREANRTSSEEEKLFLIEFARNNYSNALLLFGRGLLDDAHFIYLDVGVDTCIERIHQRVAHPVTSDDLFVSDEIMSTYYRNDDWSRVLYNLQNNCNICVIRNSGTLQDLKQEVEEWVDIHLKSEVVIPDGYVTVG